MNRKIKLALVGAGMFGGDVHLRAYADVQRFGLSGLLARVGMDAFARPLAEVEFELVAVATRSAASAARAAAAYAELTGSRPAEFCGETPWEDIVRAHPDLDVMAIATPDNLHTPVTLCALQAGAHVIVEKPMCLFTQEADQIIAASEAAQRIVCVDMHKRYDPDHVRIRHDIQHRIGAPIYGRAILEEPLEVSTSTFKWVEQSDPFSYVGPHWVDLIYSYYHSEPLGLTAVGQQKRLVRDGIQAFDAVQVRVDYRNGMSITYQNNWITPADFEGPVNQEHEIVGADGKVESDQQYRGFRFWWHGGGSRTSNNHFTRDIRRPDGSQAYIGYGTDSIHVGLLAACRMKFLGASLADVDGTYPTAREGRHTVAIVHAAQVVRDRNWAHVQAGRPPCVTAGFGPDGITIIDPYAEQVFERIYEGDCGGAE
ncbi:MAG: Gfo/Idh/MocA family oxidoreductase [Fimbriimonadaceae bacterium]|nr:Gfo/Idh/MocA family oxidoreductase [Fimbriimonadaceae bacterium]